MQSLYLLLAFCQHAQVEIPEFLTLHLILAPIEVECWEMAVVLGQPELNAGIRVNVPIRVGIAHCHRSMDFILLGVLGIGYPVDIVHTHRVNGEETPGLSP